MPNQRDKRTHLPPTRTAAAGHMWRWRAGGVGFLLAASLAVGVGVLETIVSQLRFVATAADLLYGINLHLLLALVVVLAARFVLWRVPARSFPPAALGAVAVAELALVVPYWVATASWAPVFETVTGKGFAAAMVAIGALMGGGFGWLAVRRWSGERWSRAAGSATGLVGVFAVLGLLTANGIALVSAWPRPVRPAIRPEAAQIECADVIVILVDTLRRDHLSCFGYPRPTSPNIDRLFGESYLFSAAYAPSNKTIPSVASLFTGLYPTSCGVRGPYEAIPEDAPTLAEHFRSYGHQTAAFVANLILTPQGGFAQGFDTYFPRSAPWWTHRRRTAVELIAQRLCKLPDTKMGWRINQAFFSWLDSRKDGPIFAYLHYMEPHSPYLPSRDDLAAVAPNAPWGPTVPPLFHDYSSDEECIDWECLENPPTLPADMLEGMIARYDGEIHALDRHIGELLEVLEARGLLERAHLLFLTDHGEQFGDHLGWYHGHSIYEELVASPMAYRPPGGLRHGVVIDRPVAMLDLLRTLLEILQLETPPMHQGRVISELLPTRGTQASPPASSEFYRAVETAVLSELPPHLYTLRLGQWKLVRRGHRDAPDWGLYRLSQDPGERVDLCLAEPDTLALLRSYLLATLASLEQERLDLMRTTLDQETLRQLRDLGYIR